jgi:hypothetical protein
LRFQRYLSAGSELPLVLITGCLKSPDFRQILSSVCSLQLPESWREACTTFCELSIGRTFQTSSKISWRSAIRLASGPPCFSTLMAFITCLLSPPPSNRLRGPNLPLKRTDHRRIRARLGMNALSILSANQLLRVALRLVREGFKE